MKVNDLHSVVRGLDPRDPRMLDRSTDKPAAPTQETADGDSLDVSLSAHVSARSAENAATDAQDASELTPDRISEISGRVQSGFYNSPAVLAESANRILTFYSR